MRVISPKKNKTEKLGNNVYALFFDIEIACEWSYDLIFLVYHEKCKKIWGG